MTERDSTMWTGDLNRRQDIIGNIIWSGLLLLVLSVSISARLRTDDVRLQMIEVFARGKFDTLNQSDIHSLMSMMSKTVRRGRTFHYMWKLRGALEVETKRLDSVEDHSSKDWLIQAFRPAVSDETTITFTNCALCNRTRHESRCNVTRVELLVPLIHKDFKNDALNYWISVEVNGHTINNSRGTVEISRAAIFDLSSLLIKPDYDTNDMIVRVTTKKQPCRSLFLKRSMLYEYCNINSTILERFSSFHLKESKDNISQRRNQTKGEIVQVNNNSSTFARADKTASNIKRDSEIVEGSHETENKKSRYMLEHTTRSVSPAKPMKNMQEVINSTHFYEGEEIMHTSSPTDTELAQSSEPAIYDRKARSVNELEAFMLDPQTHADFSQTSEHQPVHSNESPRKTNKKKRYLGGPELQDLKTNRRDGACKQRLNDMTGECKRHSFFVSFQVHMNRWDIVMPDSLIDIGYCASSCRHANHFANVNSELTAHAVIVNSMSGKTPGVICSPHKMSTISILKINDQDMSLVVENLFNAKIESCWCT